MNKATLDWQRAKTTRLYVTPPMSERLYTFWREGKMAFGEMDVALTTRIYKTEIISAGLWILHGEIPTQFDFKACELVMHPDGIPVHTQRHKLGALDVILETYADFGIRPNGYMKVRVENNVDKTENEILDFMLRTGLEKDIVFCGPDVYDIFNPTLDTWYAMPATYKRNGNTFADGDGRTFKLSGDIDFDFSEESGIGKASLSLAPGESCEAIFAYNIGEVYDFDYEKGRAECISLWEKELSRITKLPERIINDTETFKIIKNLTVQLLQCFALPKGYDVIFARQGCLQRMVWLYETMTVIEALSRIGDFDSYIEPIIDSYFSKYQKESGEVSPLAIPWAMATANALQSFGNYALLRDKEYFDKYFDRAYNGYLWIKKTRVHDNSDPRVVSGLFPPKASCDDQFVFQSWCSTDTFNIRGMRAFAAACEKYEKTDAAKDIKAEIEDYLAVMYDIWNEYVRDCGDGDLYVRYSPSLPDEVVMANFAFSPHPSYFLDCLDLPEDQVERIFATHKKKKYYNGDGLLDRMPDLDNSSGIASGTLDENGKCLIWYVCNQEFYWFKYFLRHGRCDRAKEILRGVYKYAMTDEYYMFERYHQRNPWFAPWSPNASASGRFIIMLLDYYGKLQRSK